LRGKQRKKTGKGITGDVLKNVIGMTDLGVVVEPPRLQVPKATKTTKTFKN